MAGGIPRPVGRNLCASDIPRPDALRRRVILCTVELAIGVAGIDRLQIRHWLVEVQRDGWATASEKEEEQIAHDVR